MADLTTSNNKLLNEIGKNLDLDAMYKQGRTEQQNQLKKIFTVIDKNNVSKAEREELEGTAAKVKANLDVLEGKLANLEEQIAEKEDAINKKAEEIAKLVSDVNDESNEMEKEQHKKVAGVINDVFKAYEAGNVKKDAISSEINIRIRGLSNSHQRDVEQLLKNLDNNQDEVKRLTADAQKWIDDKNLLNSQYGVTKSAYDLLSKTLDQIGNTDKTYTNSNTDTNIPVYSLDKTLTVSNLFTDERNLNVPSTNTNYDGTGVKQANAIKEKYKKYFTTQASGADPYSASNPAFGKLGNAIKDGMLNDLKKSNMTNAEILEFLATNFSGAMFSYDKKSNVLTLPYGHGEIANGVCNQIRSFVAGLGKDRYIKNTWDKDNGNTIDSNKQLATLAGNYESIIDELAKGNPPFNFKEGMYALFGENGLFKNCGIRYDVSKQDGKASYTIDMAGDKETSDFYEKIAAKIKDVWGVDATFTNKIGTADIGGKGNNSGSGGGNTNPPSTHSTDPISFETIDEQGNKVENSFIIDRNKDGKFGDMKEFVGAQEGRTWLEDLKELDADHDGILSGDELKNLKILSSTYRDNIEGNAKSDTKTEIEYKISNAFDMGIEEINLEDLENKVNQSTGKKDINGSDLFNDSFTFKMNGQEMTAKRKDDTDAFMNTVYKDATGKSFEIGHSEKDVQDVIDESYGVMDKFNADHGEFFDNVEFLMNFDRVKQETHQLYEQAVERMETDTNVQRLQAANKAAALGQSSNWGSIQAQVIKIANDEGIVLDQGGSVMEQMRGIFMRDNTITTARQVVDKYKEQQKMSEDVVKERNQSSTVAEALIKCNKNGVSKATAAEIKALLLSGQAKDADDVVKILKEKYNTGK